MTPSASAQQRHGIVANRARTPPQICRSHSGRRLPGRGLSHEDAARFSFLLATPVILAVGILEVPDLFGPLGQGIGGQVLVGSIASFVSAYLAVRFLTRYFETRTLTPCAIYSTIVGAASLGWLTLR